MQEYFPYFLLTQGLIIAILTSKVIADFIRDRRRRKQSKQDDAEHVSEVNEAKVIDANSLALKMFSDRLNICEARVDANASALSDARVEKAIVEQQNLSLTEERERMRGRMHDLATNLQSKEGEMHNMRQELHQTQLELTDLKARFETAQWFQTPPPPAPSTA